MSARFGGKLTTVFAGMLFLGINTAILPQLLTAPPNPTEVLPAPNPQEPAPPKQLIPAEVLPAEQLPSSEAPDKPPLLPIPRPITTITIGIDPKEGKLPTNLAIDQFDEAISPWEPRPWGGVIYEWEAPAFCHRPLYFQETNLERYGYSKCPLLQPALSATHFLGAAVALPYNMTVHPCHECIYPLGHYRPGSCAPYRHHWAEWRPTAGAVEAGAIAGLIFLIP